MALGTGPRALISLLESNWQANRAGRAPIPDVINYNTGTADPALNRGVLILRDREEVAVDHAKHDLIHVYHPEAAAPIEEDNGYAEKRVVEQVQIDISLTDRPDPNDASARLDAATRMTGKRDYDSSDAVPLVFDVTFEESPESFEYRGIWGEVRYILETVRRGYREWDTVTADAINVTLKKANADVSINVELEQIAKPTVQ